MPRSQRLSLTAALSLSLALCAAPALAQEITPEPTLSPVLEAQLNTLVATTERLRGLTALTPVPRQFPTRAEVRAYIAETYARELPPAALDRATTFYVALGLLEPGIDLGAAYNELLGSQVAGFYDTETKIMNVVPLTGEITDSLSPTERIIFAHEYTHALQDQRLGLSTLFETTQEADPDQALAVISLIEGDATLSMTLYTQELVEADPGIAFQILLEGAASGGLTLPAGTPPALGNELLFPYEAGLNFVTALYNRGGWEAVNEAFDNPPTRSEQILHPDLYHSGEGVAELVDIPDSAAMMGDGWTQVYDVTLGEYYLREHLDLHLGTAEASDAAAGWGNDRIHIYQNDEGETALSLYSLWDTETDSIEFYEAYITWMQDRYEQDTLGDKAPVCASDADSAVCIASWDNGTTLVTQAPTVELAADMLAQDGQYIGG